MRSRFFAGSGTAAASPIAHTFVAAVDAHRAVDRDPAASVERQPELRDDRMRLDACRPHDVRVGTTSPSLRRAVRLGDLLERRVSCGSRCRARAARASANSASDGGTSGITRSLRLDEDPAHALGAAARVAGRSRRRRSPAARRGPRARRSRRRRRRRSATPARSAGSSSVSAASSVAQHVVAQRDRVGQRLEADARARRGRGPGACARSSRARRSAGRRRARSSWPSSVRTAMRSARRVGAESPARGAGRCGELLAQRHDDVARLERAGRRAGQQRRVEHEVDVVDERDPRALGAAARVSSVRAA